MLSVFFFKKMYSPLIFWFICKKKNNFESIDQRRALQDSIHGFQFFGRAFYRGYLRDRNIWRHLTHGRERGGIFHRNRIGRGLSNCVAWSKSKT